jgi:hypothetical protein
MVLTSIVVCAATVWWFTVSVGVNVADRISLPPTGSTVPSGGVYANVPGALAVAFNWIELSGVPTTIPAGAVHVIVGNTFPTLNVAPPLEGTCTSSPA